MQPDIYAARLERKPWRKNRVVCGSLTEKGDSEMKKHTPFSNGTEFMYWQSMNCYKCKKYENESTKIEDAGCKLAFSLDLASVSDGKMDMDIAEQIGIGENGSGLARHCKAICWQPIIIDENTEAGTESEYLPSPTQLAFSNILTKPLKKRRKNNDEHDEHADMSV